MRMIVCGRGLVEQTSDAGLRNKVVPRISRINTESKSVLIRENLRLEVQLKSELELSRVERGGGAAEVAAIAGALVERPNVVDKG